LATKHTSLIIKGKERLVLNCLRTVISA